MHKKSTLITISLSIILTGCGVKERMVNLKNTVFDSYSNSDSDSNSNEYNDSSTELTGMLLVLDPEKCPLAKGCGPAFNLLGRNLQSQVAITGDISPDHHGLIISVIGTPSPLPSDLIDQSGYEKIQAMIEVSEYRLRSSIPYHGFLVEQASVYTTQSFGCDLLWDKSFQWSIEDGIPELSVRMTDTFNLQPQPWVELIYNGNNGALIRKKTNPKDLNPCDS